MICRNYSIILIGLIMFSFTEKVEAKYDKLFFDLSIENIDNEIINLNKYRGKTILLVNVASISNYK